jgi:hypothetical protein
MEDLQMNSRKTAVVSLNHTSAVPKKPTIITAAQASVLRELQQDLVASHDYVREANEKRHQAEVKRHQAEVKCLCAGLLRDNGHSAEAREIAAEARKLTVEARECARQASRVGALDRAITRDLRAFDKREAAGRVRAAAEIDQAILEGVTAGRLTRSGNGEYIAGDELIGLPEWGPAPLTN